MRGINNVYCRDKCIDRHAVITTAIKRSRSHTISADTLLSTFCPLLANHKLINHPDSEGRKSFGHKISKSSIL